MADVEVSMPSEVPTGPVDDMEVQDFTAPEPELEEPLVENGEAVLEATEPKEEKQTALYFVRIPRPPVDDTEVKKLQQDFMNHVQKLRLFNEKVSKKKAELGDVKRKLQAARSCKAESREDYNEKSSRLGELKKMREEYERNINAIKEVGRGLDAKSEEDLDEKIKECEYRIAHEGLPLREEKNQIQMIAKLKAQRDRVRDYQASTTQLPELEAEVKRIRAMMNELGGEYGIIRKERDSVQSIIKEIEDQFNEIKKDLDDLLADQAELQAKKDEALDALETSRRRMDETMKDFRENRAFSGQIRTLVEQGQLDQARELCAQQSDSLVSKVISDAKFRSEYTTLWAQQRKYVVSELLPDSANAEVRAASAKPADKGGKPARVVPKPNGAQKAQDIIASVMQEASREFGSRAAAMSDDDEPMATTSRAYVPPARAEAVATAIKPLPPPKSSETSKVELPIIPDVTFELPEAVKSSAPTTSDSETKDKLREEQRKKAAEAEARKKKKAEQAEKRKVKAEIFKQQEEEAKAQRAKQQMVPGTVAKKAAPETSPEQSDEDAAEQQLEVARAPAVSAVPIQRPVKAQKQAAAAAAPVPVKKPKPSKFSWKKFVKQNTAIIAVSIFAVILLLLIVFVTSS